MADEKENNPAFEVIAWDIDTTGKKFIDEMCQIGAHSPVSYYKQYIMPYRDIDFNSRKRFLLKTVSLGYYRVLRETVTGKILKTKTEISALTEFVGWLEERKTLTSRDVILMYNTPYLYTPAPFLLLESLTKYGLLERFKNCVRGFANSMDFIKDKCQKSIQSNSIKTLAKILLNKDHEKNHDALERARILYEIVEHLSDGELVDGLENISAGLLDYTSSVEEIQEKVSKLKLTLVIQSSLKPIFGVLIQERKKRRQALILRRFLTNSNIDYESLKAVIIKKEELKLFLKENINDEITDENLIQLETIVAKHFGSNGNEETTKINSTSTSQKASYGGGSGKSNTRRTFRPKSTYKNKISGESSTSKWTKSSSSTPKNMESIVESPREPTHEEQKTEVKTSEIRLSTSVEEENKC